MILDSGEQVFLWMGPRCSEVRINLIYLMVMMILDSGEQVFLWMGPRCSEVRTNLIYYSVAAYLQYLFVLLVILWRKFIYDKSASGMLINPQIAFTFTRQR
jgi:hypothetical protein